MSCVIGPSIRCHDGEGKGEAEKELGEERMGHGKSDAYGLHGQGAAERKSRSPQGLVRYHEYPQATEKRLQQNEAKGSPSEKSDPPPRLASLKPEGQE